MNKTDAMRNLTSSGKTILEQEAGALRQIAERLDDTFASAVTAMHACSGKIIISGMGKSGIIAQKIAATMASTGTTAMFLHPADAAHGDLGIVSEGDVVICLSKSGTTEELNFILPALRRIGVAIIALTGNPRSYLARNADIVLDTGIDQEACPFDLAPTSSTTAMLAMGDALAITLMQAKQFTPRDFALTHPKGALGRRLTMKASDIMASGDALPIVDDQAVLGELILEMTSKRYGVSAIVDRKGKLSGIFTDGDLRRIVQKGGNFLQLSARSVMTENPKSVPPDTLAKECLDILETFRITQLMVCDNDNRPVGIIHIHDLITLGL
ncbi:KpsF/GutQ family protein [Chlorobium limicola DSM 245]|jgi:arabinose-5-phosphate isomerase|uniref:KpsF/GutQ family protein n=1 Tax=Chlorobium limicola (strain DSM 245 / NBRC 103803 / 6330) TaxID=290315 RepID=B3EFE4_CHLL2|nr:KpsF/GutQ family sugar-phosphate isomerase [Chlorobium limicola]ACD89427.1 KpsF/GutQ family protein [Chlorobium limicola DSM 245]